MASALVETRGPRGLVYIDIEAERERQDAQWGGASHDDEHECDEWIDFIREHADEADEVIGAGEDNGDISFRARLVEIAALAVAAIESLDRHTARNRG